MGPLAGIKVVEMAGIGPAPCAGMMLADLGAEVMLVERAVSNTNKATVLPDENKQTFYNRGKKSISIDLKNKTSVELVLKIIEQSDVLIEGFRPGVMERLGLGCDICLARNPSLVYGRMTGWGQYGPLANAAGHDPNYIATSGALWYGGRGDHQPTAPLTLVGDIGGGTMVLLFGLLSAVIHSQQTGQGQVVDAAVTDGSVYISSLLWMMKNTGQLKDELGRGWADGAAPWNDTYQCADGKYITICSLEPQFYRELLERLELLDNPTFVNQWDKSQWQKGKEILTEIFLGKTRAQWCDLLEGTDVCFGPVLDFSEAQQHPHNIVRKTILNIDGVVQPAPAPKFSHSQPLVGKVPVPGEHGKEIIRGLNLDDDFVSRLKASGSI